MWLRDALPLDLPCMRTMIYGYDTTLDSSESFQTVQDIAISFVSRLASNGRSGPSAKPLVFLAHSLGGVVLKHALLEMANSAPRRHIFEGVRAVVFFGVPHKGMSISHLQSMVGGQPNLRLVEDLGPQSTYLRVLDDQFSGLACQSVRVFSVFETKRSRTVQVCPSTCSLIFSC
jgi:triacylglycerol esterase/lipase EstA (alpha/beta hydrolase family)